MHKPGGLHEKRRVARRETKLTANLANQALVTGGVEVHSEDFLRRISVAAVRRLAAYLGKGRPDFLYVYTCTIRTTSGWNATDEERDASAEEESTNVMINADSPLIRATSRYGWRNIRHEDIWYPKSDAKCVVLALSPTLSDVSYIEWNLHKMMREGGEVVGFKGNIKDGGTPQQEGSFLFGCCALILPRGVRAMGLSVRDDCIADFEAAQQTGSDGKTNGCRRNSASLPAMQFVRAPLGTGGEFLLGGDHVHRTRLRKLSYA
jgi:hypothetical protein